jgi:hypothetical protein
MVFARLGGSLLRLRSIQLPRRILTINPQAPHPDGSLWSDSQGES